MDLPGLTWRGAPLDDVAILERLPPAHAQLLAQRNGFVAFGGALHVRGACLAPAWHALRSAWEGPLALCRLFPTLAPDDVPFGETATGTQLVLRGGLVHRLDDPLAAPVPLGLDPSAFVDAALDDPVATLELEPLAAFQAAGGRLAPGQLLAPDPAAPGGWRAVPSAERRRALAQTAREPRTASDG